MPPAGACGDLVKADRRNLVRDDNRQFQARTPALMRHFQESALAVR